MTKQELINKNNIDFFPDDLVKFKDLYGNIIISKVKYVKLSESSIPFYYIEGFEYSFTSDSLESVY